MVPQLLWEPKQRPRPLVAIYILCVQKDVHWMEIEDLDALETDQPANGPTAAFRAVKASHIIFPRVWDARDTGPQ